MFLAVRHQRSGPRLARVVGFVCALVTLGPAFHAVAQAHPRAIPTAAAQALLSRAEALAAAGKPAEALQQVEALTGSEYQFSVEKKGVERRLRLLWATLLSRTQGQHGAIQALKLLSPDLERVARDRTLRLRLAEFLSYVGDGMAKAAALGLIQSATGTERGGMPRDPGALLTLARLRWQDMDLAGTHEALFFCRKRAAQASACSGDRLSIAATALTPEDHADLLAVLHRLSAMLAKPPSKARTLPVKPRTVCTVICKDPEDPLCE